VLRKTVKRITELARSLSAKVVVGKFSSKVKDKMESNKNDKLRHRIAQEKSNDLKGCDFL